LFINPTIKINKQYNTASFVHPVMAKEIKNKLKTPAIKNTDNQDTDKPITDKKDEKNPLIGRIFTLLTILLGATIIVYIYKLFKKLKKDNKVSNQSPETVLQEKEAETITDAVCSFVKHRIKYK